MRITIPIAAGGGRSQTRLPMPSASLEECLGPNGKIDRAKAQVALADRKFFCPSGGDDEYVYFAALTLLGTIHDAYKQVEARPEAVVSAREICKQDTLNSRKVERGKVVYAKIIIERKASTVRVRFAIDNPRNLVGEYEVEARECLIACAEIMLRMRKDFKWLDVVDCEITAEAERRNEEAERKRLIAWYNSRRLMCKCMCATGHCSPIHPKCRFYAKGMCNEITEVNNEAKAICQTSTANTTEAETARR